MSLDITRDWWRPPVLPDQNRSQLDGSFFAASTDSGLPFAAVVAFTIILLLAPQNIFTFLGPLRIAMLAAVIAVLSLGWSRLSKGLALINLNQGTVLVLLLAAWAVLTLPMSFWPGGSVSFLLAKYFKTLLVFFLLATVINSISRLRSISWVLVLVAVPLAATTLKNFATGALLSGSQRVVGYNSPLAENPNDLALMLNLILPFAIALFLLSHKVLVRLVLVAIICLMVAAIIATFSRAGFLTLAVIYLVYAWRLRTRPQRMLAPVIFILALASLPLLPASYLDRIDTITNIEADDSGSAQTRWSDTVDATRLIFQQPLLGSGVGMNLYAMNEVRGETWTEIHNVYLSLGVELGLPGLFLFLALYRYCLICTGMPARSIPVSMRSLRADDSSANKDARELLFLAEAVKVSLVAFGIAAFFHPVAYHFYFYYIAGLAVAIGTICERKNLLSPVAAPKLNAFNS